MISKSDLVSHNFVHTMPQKALVGFSREFSANRRGGERPKNVCMVTSLIKCKLSFGKMGVGIIIKNVIFFMPAARKVFAPNYNINSSPH